MECAVGLQPGTAVRKSKSRGRCVVAAAPLPANAVVCREEPLVWTIAAECAGRVCDACFKYDRTDILRPMPLKCSSCSLVAFCSPACEELAQNTWHRWECEAYRKLNAEMSVDSDTDPSAGFCVYLTQCRFLIRMASIMAHDPVARASILSQVGDASTLPGIQRDLVDEVRGTIVRCTSRDLWGAVGADLLHLAALDVNNSFGVYYTQPEWLSGVEDRTHRTSGPLRDDRLFAFGQLPLSSLLNHSCIPNCYKEWSGRTLYLRTLHAVPAGAELTHCYVTPNLNSSRRQEELRCNHLFDCRCRRCTDVEADLDFTEVFVCHDARCGGLMVGTLPSSDSTPTGDTAEGIEDGEVLLRCQWCGSTRAVEADAVARVEAHQRPWAAD